MPVDLIVCEKCSRHHKGDALACPFCDTAISSSALPGIATVAAVALSGALLTACGPSTPPADGVPGDVTPTATGTPTPPDQPTATPPDDQVGDGERMKPMYGMPNPDVVPTPPGPQQ